jgi:hypothetical protein
MERHEGTHGESRGPEAMRRAGTETNEQNLWGEKLTRRRRREGGMGVCQRRAKRVVRGTSNKLLENGVGRQDGEGDDRERPTEDAGRRLRAEEEGSTRKGRDGCDEDEAGG